MSRNAYFSGVLRPRCGEIISSWIDRGLKTDLRFEQVQRYIIRNNIDIDSRSSVASCSIVIGPLNVSASAINSLCYDSWRAISPPFNRRFFCKHCCVSDLINTRSVAVYRNWGFPWVSGCALHRCRLSVIRGYIKNFRVAIVDDILDDCYDLEDIVRVLNAMDSVGSTMGALSCRRMDPVLEIGLTTQNYFSIIFERSTILQVKVDTQKLLMLALKIILRKRIKPYEASGFVKQLQRGAKQEWLEGHLHDNLLAKTLEVELSEYDPHTRMAALAVLGYCMKIPRCVKLWKHYSKIERYPFSVFRDYSPEDVFSEILSTQFVDYRPLWEHELKSAEPNAGLLFTSTLDFTSFFKLAYDD